MSLDLTPLQWNWDPVVTGDTYPAAQITETSSETALSAVRLKIRASGSSTPVLSLSGGSGITITTTTAGAWDFTIDAIDTSTLDAGIYAYDIETTDSEGTVRTELQGIWQIIPEITT